MKDGAYYFFPVTFRRKLNAYFLDGTTPGEVPHAARARVLNDICHPNVSSAGEAVRNFDVCVSD